MKFTKRTIAGIIGGAVLAGGSAYAAMTIIGTGSASASAYQAQNLTISGVHFDKQIWPGVQASLIFDVANKNPFPVTLNQIGYDSSHGPATVNCATSDDITKLSVPGLPPNSTTLNLPAGIVVPAHTDAGDGTTTVTVPNVLHLDEAATGGCTITVPFKVTGLGAGN